MLNDNDDRYIPLTEVPDVLPMRRRGKKLHVSTIWRWARRGAGSRQLKTWQIGGMTCTTMAAINEFINGPAATKPPIVDKPKPSDAAPSNPIEGGW